MVYSKSSTWFLDDYFQKLVFKWKAPTTSRRVCLSVSSSPKAPFIFPLFNQKRNPDHRVAALGGHRLGETLLKDPVIFASCSRPDRFSVQRTSSSNWVLIKSKWSIASHSRENGTENHCLKKAGTRTGFQKSQKKNSRWTTVFRGMFFPANFCSRSNNSFY